MIPNKRETRVDYGQAICGHAAPNGAQKPPQLGLQQYSPSPQTVLPQVSPPQNSWVQKPPTGAQMLQLWLQQNSPAPQVT